MICNIVVEFGSDVCNVVAVYALFDLFNQSKGLCMHWKL